MASMITGSGSIADSCPSSESTRVSGAIAGHDTLEELLQAHIPTEKLQVLQ